MTIMYICWSKLWKFNYNPRNEQSNIYKMQATIHFRSQYGMSVAVLSFAIRINAELYHVESIYTKFTQIFLKNLNCG
jgi:hypothetical protein